MSTPRFLYKTLRLPARIAFFILFVTSSFELGYAQSFSVLYSFIGAPDGARPYAGLIQDSSGNLYGTTRDGGGSQWCPFGCGIIFKIDPAGNETILHHFQGTDGANPQYGNLLRDAAGNLYGTAYSGGTSNNGVLFRLSSTGKLLELSFPGGAKGGFPYAGVIMDPAGNLYGTTFLRGRGAYGTGIAYKVDPAGKETVVHTFLVSEGQNPVGAMVRDASGNLYGTTEYGGMNECFSTAGEGCGTAFKIDGTGKETILHEFGSSIDGANPTGDLVMDAAANIYGTTQNGGLFGSGAVFKIDPNGIESILYSFQGPPDGYAPSAGLVIDSAGNLYGTTTFGGANSFFGTVFKIDTTGQETILYSFQNSKDGANPYSKLALDAAGNLYGTTSGGTSTLGTVFKITPQ